MSQAQRFRAAATPTVATASMHGLLISASRGFMQPRMSTARLAPPQNLRTSASQTWATEAARASVSPQGPQSLPIFDSKHSRRRPPLSLTLPHEDLKAKAQDMRDAADASAASASPKMTSVARPRQPRA